VSLGTISVINAVPDNEAAEAAIVFMPNLATKGFELSDDPFLNARADVYDVAFRRR